MLIKIKNVAINTFVPIAGLPNLCAESSVSGIKYKTTMPADIISEKNIKICNSAKIFLVAVLEYLTYEIFDLSIIFCKNDNRNRINKRTN